VISLCPLAACSFAKRLADDGEMVEHEMCMKLFVLLAALLASMRLFEILSTTCLPVVWLAHVVATKLRRS
jgi:hypothetical protein